MIQKPELKLAQESILVVIEQPDVIDLVPQHRDAIDPDAEREALMLLRIQSARAQHFGPRHAAPQNLKPASARAQSAALLFTHHAADVHLRAGRRERKIAGAKTQFRFRAEQALG